MRRKCRGRSGRALWRVEGKVGGSGGSGGLVGGEVEETGKAGEGRVWRGNMEGGWVLGEAEG